MASLLAALALAGLGCSDSPSQPKLRTGAISVVVDGLPPGVEGEITLSGPAGFTRRITTSQLVSGLTPGSYTVAGSNVVTATNTFVPSSAAQTVTITASDTPAMATVTYSVTNGSLRVVMAGLPPGITTKVLIVGDPGFRDSVFADATLGNLAPGVYTIIPGEALAGVDLYAPRPATFNVAVAASITSAQAVIGYYLASGSLSLLVNGLPAGGSADMVLTGPAGFQQPITGSRTLDGLREGRYDLVANRVAISGMDYAPSPVLQTITVFPGATARGTVNYTATGGPGGALNLRIDAIQVQQVVQTYGNTVPLVSGRDALVRVFVRASTSNTAAAAVRLRLYNGGNLASTVVLPPPADSVPTAVTEGALSSSWNYLLPAALVRPGLAVLADVDPDNAVSEAAEDDNAYPSAGTPMTLDVRDVPPMALRLVPVLQTATGLTGDVNPGNAAAFTSFLRRVLPLRDVQLDVRAPFTSSAPAVVSNNANQAWQTILNEVEALRVAEGTASHYYGVVKTPYMSGTVGLAYVPGKSGIGWDVMPSGGEIIAHELGHNFGRFHSPCGGPGGVDANFPYTGGASGVYGYDALTGVLRPPTSPDVMGYCTGRWISDYTYLGIMYNRAVQSAGSLGALLGESAAPRPGLLVWGRTSRDGVVLEPAFEVVAPPRLPSRQGSARLEFVGAAGGSLLTLSFDGDPVADGAADDARQFAFVVPLDALGGREVARLRLVAPGGWRERASDNAAPVTATEFAANVERSASGRVRLDWRHAPGRGVLVREARSGAILAFGRDGSAVVETAEQELELTFSDGMRSYRLRAPVRGGPPRR